MGLAMLTIWAFSMIESTMTLARRDGAGRIILATMGGGLVMNSSIPTAFATGAWGFVVPMVLIQVGRSLAARHYDVYDELRAHRPAMAAWSLLSAVPWVLGALAAPGPRLAWCVLALGIDLLGTRLGHPVPWNRDNDLSEVRFDIEHQASRTRRLLLICLGQAIVTTDSALSGDVRDPARVGTALAPWRSPSGRGTSSSTPSTWTRRRRTTTARAPRSRSADSQPAGWASCCSPSLSSPSPRRRSSGRPPRRSTCPSPRASWLGPRSASWRAASTWAESRRPPAGAR